MSRFVVFVGLVAAARCAEAEHDWHGVAMLLIGLAVIVFASAAIDLLNGD